MSRQQGHQDCFALEREVSPIGVSPERRGQCQKRSGSGSRSSQHELSVGARAFWYRSERAAAMFSPRTRALDGNRFRPSVP
jgi:hypothetical protein